MLMRSLRWLLILSGVIVIVGAIQQKPSLASPQQGITVVTSYWRYEYDPDSSFPHRVYVAGEIKNTSGQYLKNVAVRTTLKTASGSEIDHSTEVPLKEALAPGESTFFHDTIYDDAAFLTSSVDFLAFGDPSNASEYPYLPDPEPLYIHSDIDGGYITFFGEILNTTEKTWKAHCELCNAANLIGAYYENGELVEWHSLGVAPDGHLSPGNRIAFRFSFERVPNGSFKLFSRVEALPDGQYATTWAVENLQWTLQTNSWGSKEVAITARVVNTSDVSAEPNVWFVGRDETGQWIGWTNCFIWGEIAPGGYKDCSEEILSINMHVGSPEDIRSVDTLIASSAISHQPPPTATPTITPTPTNTPVPTYIYLPSIVK